MQNSKPQKIWKIKISKEDLTQRICNIYRSQVLSQRSELVNEQLVMSRAKMLAKWIGEGRKFLLLMGYPGTGKTTYLRVLSNLLGGYTISANSLPEMVCNYMESFNHYRTCKVLLIDDLGTEPNEVKYFGNSIFPANMLIEERYNRNLITIISTNYDVEELTERYGQRIGDRLKDFSQIAFSEKSYRGL